MVGMRDDESSREKGTLCHPHVFTHDVSTDSCLARSADPHRQLSIFAECEHSTLLQL